MITWVLVTKDYPISLKLSFSVIKHRDNLKQNPNISVGRFSCAEYLPLAWPMSNAGCTEKNEMAPVPRKWVNGLLKQLPPASDLPQRKQTEEQCCLPDMQGRKQRASFTKVKQESVQHQKIFPLIQILLSIRDMCTWDTKRKNLNNDN